MAVSYDLISQFAKITNDTKNEESITNTFGTFRKIANDNQCYVILDGSDILTPCTTMVAAKNGDKVAVQIKNHSVTVVGSTSSPAALDNDLTVVKDEVGNVKGNIGTFNTIISDKVEAEQVTAILAQFDNIQSITARIEELTAVNAQIDELKSTYANIDTINAHDVEVINAKIESIHSTIIDSHLVDADSLKAIDASITNLYGYNASFSYLSTDKLKAVEANIKSLEVDKLDAKSAEILYANIDFTNIKMAAIEHLFSESGIIKNITSETGTITGELVGVTIQGDLIEGNSIRADKLVILGEDGAYYKLNINGLNNISTEQATKFEAIQTKPENWETNYKDYYKIVDNKYVHLDYEEVPTWNPDDYYKLSAIHGKGLDGTNIIAKSITADRISVSDLVAFGATIGGYHIGDHSLYSGVKTSATNTTRGVYMDDSGQFAIGDSSNFLRYYLDEKTRTYKLEVSAGSIHLGASSKSLEETITDINKEMNTMKDEMTINLRIESSRGTVFKNNTTSTILSVIIYRGSDRITDMKTLKSIMGNGVYLQWKWRRIDDESYGVISASDSHISNDGFTYTITPDDVDTQVTFMCELINN